jgi:hypothetical protein
MRSLAFDAMFTAIPRECPYVNRANPYAANTARFRFLDRFSKPYSGAGVFVSMRDVLCEGVDVGGITLLHLFDRAFQRGF